MSSYVVKNFQPGLWTVGHYQPDGRLYPDSDHRNQDKAAERCHFLNGGTSEALAAERDALAKQLADLRTSLDYAAGQWAANAMPHTMPHLDPLQRDIYQRCSTDLRHALKANAPDAADLRAVVTEMLDWFWEPPGHDNVGAETKARVDDWRVRARLDGRS